MESTGMKRTSVTISATLYRLVALAGLGAIFVTGDPLISGGILAFAMALYSLHQIIVAQNPSLPTLPSIVQAQPENSRCVEYRRLQRDLSAAYSKAEETSEIENSHKQAA